MNSPFERPRPKSCLASPSFRTWIFPSCCCLLWLQGQAAPASSQVSLPTSQTEAPTSFISLLTSPGGVFPPDLLGKQGLQSEKQDRVGLGAMNQSCPRPESLSQGQVQPGGLAWHDLYMCASLAAFLNDSQLSKRRSLRLVSLFLLLGGYFTV